jgi:hypothetical protein
MGVLYMDENLGFWELVVILMIGILIASTILAGNFPKFPATYSGVEKTINIVAYTETTCIDSYYNVYTTPLNINVGIHSHGGIGQHTVRIDYYGNEKVISDIKIDGKWMSDIQKSEFEKLVVPINKSEFAKQFNLTESDVLLRDIL